MGGISVMLLMGMLSAMYVFFIAVIAVLIIYFAVSYVFESIAAVSYTHLDVYKRQVVQWVCRAGKNPLCLLPKSFYRTTRMT